MVGSQEETDLNLLGGHHGSHAGAPRLVGTPGNPTPLLTYFGEIEWDDDQRIADGGIVESGWFGLSQITVERDGSGQESAALGLVVPHPAM